MLDIFKKHLGKWAFALFIFMMLAFFVNSMGEVPIEAKKSSDMVLSSMKNIESLSKFGEFANTDKWDEMEQQLKKLEEEIKKSRISSDAISDRNESFTLLRRSFQDYLDRSNKNLSNYVWQSFSLDKTIYQNIHTINQTREEFLGGEYKEDGQVQKWQKITSDLKIQSSLESRKVDKIQSLFEQEKVKEEILKLNQQILALEKTLEDGVIKTDEFDQNKRILGSIRLISQKIDSTKYEEFFANREFYQTREFLVENIDALLLTLKE